MSVSRSLQVGLTAAVLCFPFAQPGRATASPSSTRTAAIPRVFLPVVSKLARSPIPVYVPTWLPRIPRSVYAGRVYPGFQTFKRDYGVGPGYQLGLYTSPRVFDGAHRLFAIAGAAGGYEVDTHTRPVWLGKSGWAYLNSGTNVGTTISIVRAPNREALWPMYTYTLIYGCPNANLPWPRYLACLKHVAASMRRYTPNSR
jgi:hypothetical protein